LQQDIMNKATRMLIYLGLGFVAVLLGLVLFWYVQTRNVEVARYEVLEADGDIEIRAYPALVVAEVTRTGNRDEAVRAGFGPLARYIFAKERPGEKIAMTAPVTQKADGPSWTIQFIMPSAYNLDRLPRPTGMDVQLRELPPARRAAIRFSGWWSDDLFKTKDAILLDWLDKKGLEPIGTPTFAYYNDPFTPGILRRNEILYDLKP
jgi:DNA gyrase inhibitor GyrI